MSLKKAQELKMSKIIHKKVDLDACRITVEEIDPFKFIATFWDKERELNNDRAVYVFETFGGAMECAFDLLIERMRHHQ